MGYLNLKYQNFMLIMQWYAIHSNTKTKSKNSENYLKHHYLCQTAWSRIWTFKNSPLFKFKKNL